MAGQSKTSPDSPEFQALWTHYHKHGEDISELKTVAAKLEAGHASLEGKIDAGFDNLQADLQRSVKPPVNMIAVGTFCFIVLSGFAAVVVFFSTQTSNSLKREIDLRFDAVATKENIAVKAISDEITKVNDIISGMNSRMLVDDQREQQDAYDKGVMDARFKGLEQNFYHLDDQLHIRHRRDEDYRIRTKERLSVLEKGAGVN